ncbi:MAG: hypothetical protein V1882_03010 [Candidatus Omnitrophota bacterium]
MTGWVCPHEEQGFCGKRHKPCKPLAKGCVLEGKGLAIADPGTQDRKVKRSSRRSTK